MIPHISIVTTLYKSVLFLPEFVQKCEEALKVIKCDNYEMIFVNDGSPDDSLEVILELQSHHKNIVVVDLSRNFGHHYALMAGMETSTGDYVFTIDCDLEVSPMYLADFYKTMINNPGYDKVYGIQEKRKGKFLERVSGRLFYKMFNKLSRTPIPENRLTESLSKRKMIESLLKMGDYNLFLAGMTQWVGFKQMPFICKKGLRKGKSTYTFSKRFTLGLQAITSFSAYPLILLFKTGGFISAISILFALYILIKKIIHPEYILGGYTSLMVALLFSTGIIVGALGILGIYIDRLFEQSKNRPRYIIKDIYRQN